MRKPDPCFYDFVLQHIDVPPSEIVLVDDRAENVVDVSAVCETLRDAFQLPRGMCREGGEILKGYI